MKIKLFLIIAIYVVICISQSSRAQTKAYKHEIAIQNDNDVYLFIAQDRYYTNGININYRLGLKSDTTRVQNRVLDIEFGQKMYNGVNTYNKQLSQWDRPFAAYLYLSGELNQYYKQDQVLSLKVELGQIGPLAKGKEVQKIIHQVFHIYEVSGWDNQISNAFGVDLGIQYQKLFYRSAGKKFEISGIGSGTLGMNYVEAHVGLPMRLGRLRPFSRSIFTKGHVQHAWQDHELFLYYIPALYFHGYNATMQGNLLNSEAIQDQYSLEKFMHSHKIGLMWAGRRSSLGLSYVLQSREAKEMIYKTHQYGSLFYGLRF